MLMAVEITILLIMCIEWIYVCDLWTNSIYFDQVCELKNLDNYECI